MSDDEKVLLTPEQAIEMLGEDEGQVHAFMNPDAGILLGADWNIEQAKEYICLASSRELAGPAAQKSKHGLAVFGNRGLVFFKTKEALCQK